MARDKDGETEQVGEDDGSYTKELVTFPCRWQRCHTKVSKDFILAGFKGKIWV